MRILLVNSEYPPVGGGASTASASIASVLASEGHHVTVLTSQYQDLPRKSFDNDIQVIRIPARRKRLDRSNPGEQLTFMLSAMWHAWRLTRTWKPDVTISFFGVPSGPAAYLLKLLYGVPYVVSLRGSDVPGFRSYDFSLHHKLLSPLIRFIWRNASKVIANSRGLRDLANSFEPSLPISVITNGVNPEKFSISLRQWAPPVILTVGRLVYQKGLQVLFEGLRTVKDMEWSLLIVGDGGDRSYLERLTVAYGFNERIRFVGWQPRDNLLMYYKDANLYVHPSFDEGMSNAILEAMACGLPVLATGVAGNMEVIVDGETGMLIPQGDHEMLSEALRQILPDANLRQEMGQAGRQRVVAHYSWRRVGLEYLAIIQEVQDKLKE